MRVLPILAAVIVLVELGAAVAFWITGPTLLGIAFLVLAVASMVLGRQVRRAVKKPQPSEGYTETTYVGW